jgi:hypothetical protein
MPLEGQTVPSRAIHGPTDQRMSEVAQHRWSGLATAAGGPDLAHAHGTPFQGGEGLRSSTHGCADPHMVGSGGRPPGVTGDWFGCAGAGNAAQAHGLATFGEAHGRPGAAAALAWIFP